MKAELTGRGESASLDVDEHASLSGSDELLLDSESSDDELEGEELVEESEELNSLRFRFPAADDWLRVG